MVALVKKYAVMKSTSQALKLYWGLRLKNKKQGGGSTAFVRSDVRKKNFWQADQPCEQNSICKVAGAKDR